MSKRHVVVELSTTAFEYMVATHARKQVVCLQQLCLGIGFVQKAIRLYFDSQSEILLENKPAYHSKTKHIDVQYHFVKYVIADKKVLLENVDTLKNVVDSLKNSVNIENLSWCKESMGIEALNM